MSLLNNMLSDLDARTNTSAAPNTSREHVAEGGNKIKSIVLVAIIFAAVVASQVFIRSNSQPVVGNTNTLKTESEKKVAAVAEKPKQEVQPSDEVVVQASLTAAEPILKSSQAGDVTNAEEYSKASATSSEPARYTKLLAQAELALQKNQLTLPAEANARFYFLQVLAKANPDSAHYAKAQQGLQRVENAYVELVQNAIVADDLARAKRFVSRLTELQLAVDELARLQNSISLREQQLQLVEHPIPVEQLGPQPASTKAVAVPVNNITPAVPAENRAAQLSVSQSLISQDKTLAAKAKQLGREGSMNAEREMLKFLDAYPNALYTRLALFEYYLDAGLTEDAQWLVDKTSPADVNTLAFLRAKLLVAQGVYAEALSELSIAVGRNDLAPVLNIKMQSLAAALSQQTGDHLSAFQLYRNLLTTDKSNSTYWLGLAVSAQQLNDSATAKQGYTSVLALNDQPEAILAYAKSQLAQLRKEEHVEISQW
ncbi:tetratricopeptide repeat protein [Saccharophagus degradans]|uniref:MSHA biogenesis protein MshN n=1 Tax=Saccharophagus degradans (strain 2-40 / ATCC 43961 / DSM 17024) TaxID=203122 RepID=Q21LN0_SACD2|nr:ATPase [Saccharophagus degradans]ABD80399.1 hypothetical protein Sde_1137 [Saccharophagus degradans 2-40]